MMEYVNWHTFQKARLPQPVVEILDRHELIPIYAESYRLLKESKGKPPAQKTLTLAEAATSLLTFVLAKTQNHDSQTEVLRLKKATAEAGFQLLKAYLEHDKDAAAILPELKQSLKHVCQQFSLEPEHLHRFLALDSLDQVNQNKPQTSHTYLSWAGDHYQLAELVHQLKAQNLIKRKPAFFKIFEQVDSNTTVEWNHQFKLHLAYLIHRLHEKGFFRVRGHKGHFAFIEQNFTDFSGQPLVTKGTLRKLNQKIQKNSTQYSDVIAAVERILKDIG